MPKNPFPEGAPRSQRLQEWWLQLPLSYRTNALLYFLGACAFVFLVTTVVGGGDEPRQVEVGAGVPVTTTTTTRPRLTAPFVPTTASGSTTSTASGGSTTTSTTRPGGNGGPSPGPGPTQAAPTTEAPGGGGSDTTSPGSTAPPTTAPPTSPPTTAPPQCRNSSDPRCGVFVWDPAPEANQPMTVTVTVRPSSPRPGDTVFFDIVVEDPDHSVSDYCSIVRFGDGGAASGPCQQPAQPICPPMHGPWTPPARDPGRYTRTYTHTYDGAATFPAKFTFRAISPDRCAQLDPYASEKEVQVLVTIFPPGT